MNTNQELAPGKTPRQSSTARRVLALAQVAFANHTPAGPNSLATGQSAAVGHEPPHPPRTAGAAENPRGRRKRSYRSFMEFTLSSRQVFWI